MEWTFVAIGLMVRCSLCVGMDSCAPVAISARWGSKSIRVGVFCCLGVGMPHSGASNWARTADAPGSRK